MTLHDISSRRPRGPLSRFLAARRRRRMRDLQRRASWARQVHTTPTLRELLESEWT